MAAFLILIVLIAIAAAALAGAAADSRDPEVGLFRIPDSRAKYGGHV